MPTIKPSLCKLSFGLLALRLWHRLPLLLGALAVMGILALRGYFLLRHFRRIARPASAAIGSLPAAPEPGAM